MNVNGVNSTAAPGSIRAARRSADLTQQQLAERARCSINYVQLLERGYMPRYSDVLPRLLDVLEEAAAAS